MLEESETLTTGNIYLFYGLSFTIFILRDYLLHEPACTHNYNLIEDVVVSPKMQIIIYTTAIGLAPSRIRNYFIY